MRLVRIVPKEQAVAPCEIRTLFPLFPLLSYIWDLMNATEPELTKTPPPPTSRNWAEFPLIEEDVIVTVPEET